MAVFFHRSRIIQASLPPSTFTHNEDSNPNGCSGTPPAPGTTCLLTQTSLTGDPAEGLGGPLQNPPTPSNCTYTVDINGDALPDVLVGEAGNYRYYPNFGSNNFGSAVTIPNPATPFPSLCTTRIEYRRNVTSSSPRGFYDYLFAAFEIFPDQHKQREVVVPIHDASVIDMDGDRLPDILYSPGVGQWYWWRNLGNGQFADRAAISQGPSSIQLNDDAVRLVDIDADGLPDIVRTVNTAGWTCIGGGSRWDVTVYRNLGRDQSGTLQFSNSPQSIVGLGIQHYDPDAIPPLCSLQWLVLPLNISFVDLNGDGLPDFVWTAKATSGYRVYYYPNQGSQGSTGWNFGPKVGISHYSGSGIDTAAQPGSSDRWVDVNGDGLPDVLRGAGGGYFYYPLQANGSFGDRVSLGNSPSVSLSRGNYMDLADMNGDGFPDIVQGLASDYKYWALNMSDTHQLLETARNPLGGTQTLTYQRKRDGGTIRWVVSQAFVNPGEGTLSTTTYSYSGAKYAGWPHNEFRGYNRVVVTDPAGHYTVTIYHQDDARKGRVRGVQAFDQYQYDSPFNETTYSYAISTPVAGVSRADLATQVVITYDGPGGAKVARTDYANFDNYGQPRQVVTTGTNTTTYVTTTDFVYNTSAYILNRPSRTDTRIRITTETKISESWFDYDGQANGVAPTVGNLTRETRWLSGGANPVTQYAYDSFGNRTGTIDARNQTCASTGYTLKTDYDSTYQTFPSIETNALCQQVTRTYWGINTSLSAGSVSGAYTVPGLPATVTDPNNVRTDSYWDVMSRLKATVVPPDTASAPTTVLSYSVTGTAPSYTITSKRESAGGGTLDSVAYVDGLGRTVQVKSEAEASGRWVTLDTGYDERGLANRATVPYSTSTSAYTGFDYWQPMTVTFYDAVRRPTRVNNPDGTYRTTSYNWWVVTQTDEKGFSTVRTYDALNRLVSVQEPSGGGTTTYAYDNFDANGNNSQTITDAAGNLTTTVFDTLGRKTSHTDPDLGTWTYTYDPNGNLLTQRDAKLQTLTLTYDKLNRVQTKTYPDAKQIVWTYDTGCTYCIGRLRQVTDLSGSTTYTYDQRGRDEQVGKTLGVEAQNLAQNPGFETGATWPDGWSTSQEAAATFTWDGTTRRSGARSVSIADATGWADVPGTSVAYDATKTYTATAWVKTAALSPAAAYVELFFLDAGSNWIGQANSNTIGGTTDWTQLTATVTPGSAPAGTAYIQVAVGLNYGGATGTAWFDDVTFSDGSSSGAGKTFTYPAAGSARPHAPTGDGGCSYSYDANGNLASRTCGSTTRTFTWDYDNRLSTVVEGATTLAQFTYDYAGTQVKKVEGSTTTEIPFPHYRLVNGAVTKYYFANGQRVAERVGPAATDVSYYHPDHLGSSSIVSNSSAAEVKATLFYPYGSTRTETGTKQIAHKYTGQEQDSSTGLYNYGARYYDPAFMRFISADNIIPNAADPQMLNRYAYVRNNPIRLKDPTGRVPEEWEPGWSVDDPMKFSEFAFRYGFPTSLIAVSAPLGWAAGLGAVAGMSSGASVAIFESLVGGTVSGMFMSAGIQKWGGKELDPQEWAKDVAASMAMQGVIRGAKLGADYFLEGAEDGAKRMFTYWTGGVAGCGTIVCLRAMASGHSFEEALIAAAVTRVPAYLVYSRGLMSSTPGQLFYGGTGLRLVNLSAPYLIDSVASGIEGLGLGSGEKWGDRLYNSFEHVRQSDCCDGYDQGDYDWDF